MEMTREDSYKGRFRFKKDGKRHILIFSEVTMEDRGCYQVMTNGGQCEAELIVEGMGPSGGAGAALSMFLFSKVAQALNLTVVPDAGLSLIPCMQFTSKFWWLRPQRRSESKHFSPPPRPSSGPGLYPLMPGLL